MPFIQTYKPLAILDGSNWKILQGKSAQDPSYYQILVGIGLEYAPDDVSLKFFQTMLSMPNIQPVHHIYVLNDNESVNYEIPQMDIIKDGINYKESYNNGQRRTIELSLINIDGKYTPSVNTIWYGTKLMYASGIIVQDVEYVFAQGVYVVSDFDFTYSNTDRKVQYSLKDKYSVYDSESGVILDSMEFKPGIQVSELLSQISNTNTSDGLSYDIKYPIISPTISEIELQQTIRLEAGNKIASVIDQVATQMNCEYFYNSIGHLCFYPLNESMNDDEKPIIWSYKTSDIGPLQFKGKAELVNMIKVTGSNINGKIASAIVKNENLGSNINIYRIKERGGQIIQDENIQTDDAARERGEYELRKNSVLAFQQTVTVPFNPILSVNNLIELEEDELGIRGDKFLINSISYNSGSPEMQLEITNVNQLPIIGGVNSRGK